MAHFARAVPLFGRRSETGGCVATAVQQHEVPFGGRLEGREHRVEAKRFRIVVVIGVGLRRDAGGLEDSRMVWPGRLAQPGGRRRRVRARRVRPWPAQDGRPSAGSRSQHVALAYLTTEYPKGSHTFIRREILGLERSGQTVLRLAIRASDESIVEPADFSNFFPNFLLMGSLMPGQNPGVFTIVGR